MKSTTIAFGLLSGMASASVHHPRHFHQYYPRNETTAVPTTTLTVAITQVQTITSCAPTVTNCPIKNNGTEAVVTEVIDLTTIVCPATEVESVSSSVIGDHSSGIITGHTSTIETPLPTGYPTAEPPAPPAPSAPSAPPVVSESTGVVEQTLTMTVGPESSKSVYVTTIQSTTTKHITVTIETPKATPTAPGASSENGEGEGSGEGSEDSTVTSTTTGTQTVTLPNEKGECVPATVTVTETLPPATVYVTAGPSTTEVGIEAKPTPSNYPTQPNPNQGSDSDKGSDEGSDEGSDGYRKELPTTPTMIMFTD